MHLLSGKHSFVIRNKSPMAQNDIKMSLEVSELSVYYTEL